jgi:hypothetical protein
MSGDLDRMFSSLRADSDRAQLPAPVALRTRGDRRSKARAVAGLVAVALVVGGTTFGARQLLAGPVTPPQITDTAPPTTSPFPSPSPTRSTAPRPDPSLEPTEDAVSPGPTGSPVRVAGCDEIWVSPYAGPDHAGDALPDSLILRAADWGKCYVMTADRPGYPVYGPDNGPAPNVCLDGAAYPTDGDRVAGRFRHFTAGPEIGGFVSVTRYTRPGSAAEFLYEIRNRVARCATFTSPDMPGEWEARIVRQSFTGDESLLIRVGAVGTNYPGWYIGVARQGDLVVIVEPAMDLGGDLAYTALMTRKAIERL